jgi:NAD-dependent DNA ligase
VRGERIFRVTLELDPDGRVQYADCGCSWHRREKLRKGPCSHILAATALAGQERPQPAEGTATPAAPRADALAGMNFVFTGALTKFTRDQAHAMVAQRGGQTASSVSKNTNYLVAGDKAGSKLVRARELKIPVLTEDEFLALLGE